MDDPRINSNEATREDYIPLGHSEQIRTSYVSLDYMSGAESNSDATRHGGQGVLKLLNREPSHLSPMTLLRTICSCPAVCIG